MIIIFFAQFFQVFFLVMGSKLLRDDRWCLAMLNSFGISLTSFLYVMVISTTDHPELILLASSIGGSLGCGVSHLVYTRFIFKVMKK